MVHLMRGRLGTCMVHLITELHGMVGTYNPEEAWTCVAAKVELVPPSVVVPQVEGSRSRHYSMRQGQNTRALMDDCL